MSDGMNRWCGIGNAVADAELRQTQGGQAVLSFRVACSERYKDKSGNWKESTEFVSCALFGKRAESLAQYLSKGTRVYIEGKLHTSSYEARDGGGKRYKTEVMVSNVILCGSRNASRGESAGHASEPEAEGDGFGEQLDDDKFPF